MKTEITHDYGWASATAPESSSYLNPAILALAREHGAKAILDAGCGNGALCGFLALEGYRVVGVDGDANGVEIARAQYPKADFETMSFRDDPKSLKNYPRDGFDFVVSTEVVEHLYAPHELIAFCFSALRPGGVLAISTPYHGYLKNLALSLVNGWDRHYTALWHGGHIKFWSRRTLSKLLEDNGFVVSDFRGVGRAPYLWKSMILVVSKPTHRRAPE